MANTTADNYNSVVDLFQSWATSDLFHPDKVKAASVAAMIVAYISDTYDLGIDDLAEISHEAGVWCGVVDEDE